jgi:excisionase family DNA binding protein
MCVICVKNENSKQRDFRVAQAVRASGELPTQKLNGIARKVNGSVKIAGEPAMLLRIKETAERLACSVATVYDLIKSGQLIAVKVGVGGGGIRVAEQDLASFIESRRITPASSSSQKAKKVKLRHLK